MASALSSRQRVDKIQIQAGVHMELLLISEPASPERGRKREGACAPQLNAGAWGQRNGARGSLWGVTAQCLHPCLLPHALGAACGAGAARALLLSSLPCFSLVLAGPHDCFFFSREDPWLCMIALTKTFRALRGDSKPALPSEAGFSLEEVLNGMCSARFV